MALVRNGLSMKMKGRAGSFSFYSSKGRQVVRVAQNSTNYGESARRSEAQQVRRVKWANLVNMYKLMGQTLHGAFETKRSNETDYNAFMRKNLPLASVALTKDQAATGAAVVQEFQISEGSLQHVAVSQKTVEGDLMWYTSIKAAAGERWDTATIKVFTGEVIDANPWAKPGMQISVLQFTQSLEDSTPRVGFYRAEITLDNEDERLLSEVINVGTIESDDDGFIRFSSMDTDSCLAIVISDSTSGQLKVSNAKIVVGDDSFIEEFSADAQVAKAMESYGVDASRFLDSGDFKA